MYAILQSMFRESKTFSSLLNSEKCFSSLVLVKISLIDYVCSHGLLRYLPFVSGLSKSGVGCLCAWCGCGQHDFKSYGSHSHCHIEGGFYSIVAKVPKGLSHLE
jgi:hypothetical protein